MFLCPAVEWQKRHKGHKSLVKQHKGEHKDFIKIYAERVSTSHNPPIFFISVRFITCVTCRDIPNKKQGLKTGGYCDIEVNQLVACFWACPYGPGYHFNLFCKKTAKKDFRSIPHAG